MNISIVVKIQKLFRSYLACKKLCILSAVYQTKKWRQTQKWYNNGRSTECEKYQIDIVEKIILKKLNKTNDRINFETSEIVDKSRPNMCENGFEFSENFDGKIITENNILYFNFKFVCDSGGSQTRTLKDVYNFINGQIQHILKFGVKNIYFINILDGDGSYKSMDKFRYLLSKYDKHINKHIFIGRLYDLKNKKQILFL